LTSPARAALSINVGTHTLLPNTPNQTIQLSVTGGDAVQALNFNAQVADGGPELGGVVNGPDITAANIVTGTIFSGNNSGQQDPGSFPQLAIRTTTTSSGSIAASGVLATLTISTVGISSGTFPLKLNDTLNGPTDFATVPVTITDGFIVVPEPATLSILLPLLALRRARRRAR
jgi:hypothetical protein